jgi:UDP-N-acetylglucosamine 4,6-dehydratase
VLVSEEEARNTVELDDMYIIQPVRAWWPVENWVGAQPLPDGSRYASDTNTQWLPVDDLLGLAR